MLGDGIGAGIVYHLTKKDLRTLNQENTALELEQDATVRNDKVPRNIENLVQKRIQSTKTENKKLQLKMMKYHTVHFPFECCFHYL